MKIAFAAQENTPESIVDPRFGRADWLLIHDDCTNTWECIDNISGRDASQPASKPRKRSQTAKLKRLNRLHRT